MKELDEKLLKIINHYGIMPQLKYFQSEVFELNEAIINYEDQQVLENLLDIKIIDSNISRKKHIAEEIADVEVMLLQFINYYNINRDYILKVMNEKIDRQLERIQNEKQ